MTFLTRQELIAAKKVPTTTVQTEEHGEIRLAKISAAGSMQVQAAATHAVGTAHKERETSAALLAAACIDEHGAPLFSDLDAARDFLNTIGGETLTALITGAGELNRPKSQGDGGNEVAGPS